MVSLRFYKDWDCDWLKETLVEWNLFDEIWETRENLNTKIKRDFESIIVAEFDKKIIWCVFIMEDGRNAFVWRLSVKKQYRNKWIGNMLMTKVEDIVRTRWLKENWWFVDNDNIKLQKWYEDQDYTKTKNFKFIYKNLD